ncbi:MAG TPA: tol-pal system protein YbgF [Steroidobacteraceae bacterium]|nr:tol-pal system protein YbgF [Steroidobacteraceae bacterium]
MNLRSSLIVLASVVVPGFTILGCAVSPEEDPVQIRLKDLDSRVQRIERVLTNQSLMELAQRIDRLQADLRTIRGEVELLQNQSEGGKNQSRALYGDLEKRLAALETLNSVGAGGAPAGGGGALPPGGEQAAYDAAFNALKGGDYAKSIAGFKGFVAAYPTNPLASNAQYWLGEAYAFQGEYPAAIAAWQKVTTEWPDSPKAPDALVKIGFTQATQGKTGDARVTLEDVVRRFPGTSAAQLATDRLKKLK